MSQEEKLEEAKRLYKDANADQRYVLERLFPELKEYEEEKIKREIIEYIKTGTYHKEWIAWLEKRSTLQVRTGLEWVNTIDDACDKRYSEEYADGEYCHEQSFKWGFQEGVEWLEKQGNKAMDCRQNHQDSSRPNGCIVLEDFNEGEGFYKLHLNYLTQKQIEEVEEMVRMWNHEESSTSNENIKTCIGMCLTDVDEQRFTAYNTSLKECLAWLEKRGQKGYTFKALPRLLDMIEPTNKAKAYCQKLIDTLVKEGYSTDAKIVGECLKKMNGEDVPMAIMDEKQGEPIEVNPTEFDLRLNRLLKQFESLSKEELASSLNFYLNVVQNDGTYKDEEKQSKQKSFDYENANIQQKDFSPKVEPKFKVGDWIVTPKNIVLQITSIEGTSYKFNNESHYWEICYCDEKCRLWTIQDAKDGDVLALNDEVFIYAHRKQMYSIAVAQCYVDSAGGFHFDGEFGYTEKGNSIHPATKEQRDQLEKAMTDAGYTFDFEKKELKKIEQNTTWNEEDETVLNNLIYALANDRIGNDRDEYVDWLKSLKERYTWKPSDVQMRILSIYADQNNSHGTVLTSLYQDLKKLKEYGERI